LPEQCAAPSGCRNARDQFAGAAREVVVWGTSNGAHARRSGSSACGTRRDIVALSAGFVEEEQSAQPHLRRGMAAICATPSRRVVRG
jgi:hypothetical protein